MTRDADHTASSFRSGFLLLALVLLGLALVNPEFPVPKKTYRYLFVIDITQSMNVSDVELEGAVVRRLEFVKSSLEAALRALPCDSEAGLAIFTGHRAFVMFSPVEVCKNFRPISAMLQKVSWRMAWTSRSEVEKGLYSAADAALQIDHDTRLVFLTDGHEAPPLHRDIRPSFDLKPDSIGGLIGGIGGMVPSPIPHLDDDGNVAGYWRHDEVLQIDVQSLGRGTTVEREAMVGIDMANITSRIALGQEHLSSLREKHLRELAAQIGLEYDRIETPAALADTLLSQEYARYTSVRSGVGWVSAALAFLCLAYSLVITPFREKGSDLFGKSK